jgi:hypothetical protein
MHVRRRSQLTAKLLMPAVDDRILPPPPRLSGSLARHSYLI